MAAPALCSVLFASPSRALWQGDTNIWFISREKNTVTEIASLFAWPASTQKSKLVSFINAQLFWRKRIQDQYIYMSVFGSCDCVRPVCTVYETCLFCVRFSKPVFSCHRVVFLEQEKLWNASNQCTSTNRESVVFWNSSWRKTMRYIYIYIPISASSS